MSDRTRPPSPDRRLAEIVREVKIAAAERGDVVVDIRDADRARLELLADELSPIFADIDPVDDRFDFGITAGQQPRLWIDAVAHVHMGRDRRIFRFVRDTRLGRVLVSETSDVRRTADAVSRYVAERIIERERALSGDFEAWKALPATPGVDGETDGAATTRVTGPDKSALPPEDRMLGSRAKPPLPGVEKTIADGEVPTSRAALVPERKPGRGAGFVLGASWFILGCVAGAAALVVAFWDRISAMF